MSKTPDAFLSLFPISTEILPGGELATAGFSLRELAARYGTPLYMYDGATLKAQLSRLRGLLDQNYPGEAAVAYAAKVYFSTRFGRRLAGLGLDLDVVSLGEMDAARQAGFKPASIHLHGNNKTAAEIDAALEWGLHAIVEDSLDELALLEELAGAGRQPVPVWLRVTPDLDVQTNPHIATGSAGSKFGLHLASGQAKEALRRIQESPVLSLTGLHFHLGSQITDPEVYREAVEGVLGAASEEGAVPMEFSPGGGWGVRYTETDPPDDPAPWIQAVCEAVREGCSRRGWPLPRLVIEPGSRSTPSAPRKRRLPGSGSSPWMAGWRTIRARRYTAPATARGRLRNRLPGMTCPPGWSAGTANPGIF